MIRLSVTLSDDELLDFDHRRLRGFNITTTRHALTQHGDVYRAQLIAARWIDGWRQRMLEDPVSPTDPENAAARREAMDEVLRDVVAHLRQGDLIPGGVLYEDEVTGRLRDG
jgi:hypothetical protein